MNGLTGTVGKRGAGCSGSAVDLRGAADSARVLSLDAGAAIGREGGPMAEDRARPLVAGSCGLAAAAVAASASYRFCRAVCA